MYKKIHKRLSILFTCIAGLTLIIMSVCYLLMSEKNLKKNNELSFSGDVNTILTNLEQQNIITYEWLSRISSNKYYIALFDNDSSLSYNCTLPDNILTVIDQIKNYYNDNYSTFSISTEYATSHTEFNYTDSDKKSYIVSIANIKYTTGKLNIVILYPNASLEKQLLQQRIFFIAIDITGILLLFIFTWNYTYRLLKPIKESQDRQTEFISAASHELRTPIAVILSAISATDKADEIETKHFLNTIKNESNRMSLLVNDLLTLARADNKSWSLSIQDTELDTLLLESYEAFMPIASDKNINLEIILPEDMIPTSKCDKQRITQVIAVLISNAISYGKPDGYIRLSLEYTSHEFVISVEDNGIGISNEAKQHIFDRFYREDYSRSKKEHFGLGLCIAKEIIELHKGRITVADTSGGGTTFRIYIK